MPFLFPSITLLATPPHPIEEEDAVPFTATLIKVGMSVGMFSSKTVGILKFNSGFLNRINMSGRIENSRKHHQGQTFLIFLSDVSFSGTTPNLTKLTENFKFANLEPPSRQSY